MTEPASPTASPTRFRPASPHPSSAVACPSRGDSSLLEIDYQSIEYIGPVDETLLCPVCRTPFYSPITTPCGHTFCAGCINRALEIQSVCPIDRQPINKTRDYHRLPLIIKDQLDRLKVRCPNKGCGYECSREHLEGHYERRCEFTPVRCPDPACDKRVARRDALPEKGCMHRHVSCQYCDSVMAVAELDAHYDHDCAGATAKCSDCDANVVRHRLETHKSQACPEGQTQCRWHIAGCKVSGKRRVVQEHEQNGCMFEAMGRLLEQRAEDQKTIYDLIGRVEVLEMRAKRREQQREQRRRRTDSTAQLTSGAASGALGTGVTDATDVIPGENSTLFGGSASESGTWCSPEDYMLAQFERMESQMEDLRKKMMEMDAHQSLSLLQQTARVNEQLAELASKVGVLNMHTTWLMNMQRQSNAQQRAGSTSTSGPHNAGISASGGTSSARASSESGIRRQGGSRRNSEGRGENPPRL